MTSRATLGALLARVLEGTGPDRELDAEIARMIGLRVVEEGHPIGRQCYDKSGLAVDLRRYTASLDAALTLVPEGWRVNTADWSILGVYSWTLRGPCRKYVTGADGWDEAGDDWFRTARAATPPRALIAACLKARMEAQGD